MNLHRTLALVLLAGPVQAQSLRVLSEFQRVDPFGEVVPADRVPNPREILSPAAARNAFTSFHVAVTVPERSPFFLYVQTNPPNVFQISLYEELNVKTPGGWIPDVLEPVKLPAFGSLPYLPAPIAGQTTLCYWLDMWVPKETDVQRVRVEVLLKAGRGWVMYPMEVRVMPAVAPSLRERRAALPPVEARADASVYGPFRNFVCHAREPGGRERLSVRRLIRRNAEQDMALAGSLETSRTHAIRDAVLDRAGIRSRAEWCTSHDPPEDGAEWFLRVRHLLYRKAGESP